MEFHQKYKWNSFTNAIWTRSPVGWELVWPPCRRSIVSPQRGAGIWTVRTGSCSLITLFASPAQYGVWCCAPSTTLQQQSRGRDCVDATSRCCRERQWMPPGAASATKEPFFSLSRWQAAAAGAAIATITSHLANSYPCLNPIGSGNRIYQRQINLIWYWIWKLKQIIYGRMGMEYSHNEQLRHQKHYHIFFYGLDSDFGEVRSEILKATLHWVQCTRY